MVYEGGLIDGCVGEGVGQVDLGLLGGLDAKLFKLDKVVSISLIFLMIIPCSFFGGKRLQEVP
ncbi:hypothetical protein LFZ31_03870 [Salmonella enterica subsp. enterica serovar Newport str. S09097]|nr:hypothetical protein LFZ31_03870 [Salmonella enterica subsp. enterica serovar Newport str. S09097]